MTDDQSAFPEFKRVAPLPAEIENFNLSTDPWIPLANNTLASLEDIFGSVGSSETLAGTPVERIAIIKLLLAIAHSAVLPANSSEWQALGPSGVSQKALDYLVQRRDLFFLGGDKPFLQMPVAKAKVASWSQLNPQYASGNSTVLTQWQISRNPTPAQIALLTVVLGPFAMGGKKTDNSVVLSKGYQGKSKTAKPGPAVAYQGLLHSFVFGQSTHETVWLNMLTSEDIELVKAVFPHGLGQAPWDRPLYGEGCPTSRQLRASIMGRLIPMSRFILLHPEGMHYTEGLSHPSYLDGVADPYVAVETSKTKPRAIWVNPEKRPWRELPALLSLLGSSKDGFRCFGLDRSLSRLRNQSWVEDFAVWSGGMRVSSNAGEQYLTATDDMVESCLWMSSQTLDQQWYETFSQEMQELDSLNKILYGAIKRYQKNLSKDSPDQVDRATHRFWQGCEVYAQDLLQACLNPTPAGPLDRCRKAFANVLLEVYDAFCPNQTARQMDSWAKARPDVSKYRYYWSDQSSQDQQDLSW